MENLNLNKYITEAEEIEKLFYKLTSKAQKEYSDYVQATTESKPIQRNLLTIYEVWYAVLKPIVKEYSDRFHTFEKNYLPIKKHILLDVSLTSEEFLEKLISLFDEQVNIIHCIIPSIAIKNNNFKKIITCDLIDSELSQAEILYDKGFYRASGLIGGVILERFLKTLCDVNNIEIKDNDTIEPLATKLYKSEKLPDFDKTLFKSIQHLGSIRNNCAHPKEEPKSQEVRELLDKVKKITFLSL